MFMSAESESKGVPMDENLEALLKAARHFEAPPEHREEQRRTFAYGNAAFENKLITRAMVDREAEKLEHDRKAES
jgi:hypothetical protein